MAEFLLHVKQYHIKVRNLLGHASAGKVSKFQNLVFDEATKSEKY